MDVIGEGSHCKHCKKPMPAGASVCPTCRLYQNPWRTWTVFLGGAVGLVTAVVSGLFYIGGQFGLLYERATWHSSLDLIYLHTYRAGNISLILRNTSSGALFIDQIIFVYGNKNNVPFYIAQQVAKDDVLSIRVLSDLQVRSYQDLGGYVHNKDGVASKFLVDDAEVWEDDGRQHKCFEKYFSCPATLRTLRV